MATDPNAPVAIVNVSELIDIAVGPEFNIHMLNTILHIIVGHISELAGVRVQFTEHSGGVQQLKNATNKPPPAENLQLFSVNGAPADGTLLNPDKCTFVKKDPPAVKQCNELVVVKRSLWQRQHIHNDIVEASIPETSQLIEAARTGNERPLVKMMDMLNLTKRMEAAELTMQKFSRLINRGSTESVSSADDIDGSVAAVAESAVAAGAEVVLEGKVAHPSGPATAHSSAISGKSKTKASNNCEDMLKKLNEWRAIQEKLTGTMQQEFKELLLRLETLSKNLRSMGNKQDGLEKRTAKQLESIEAIELWMKEQKGLLEWTGDNPENDDQQDYGGTGNDGTTGADTSSEADSKDGYKPKKEPQPRPRPGPPPNSLPGIAARIAYIEEHCCGENHHPNAASNTVTQQQYPVIDVNRLFGSPGGAVAESCPGPTDYMRLVDKHTADIATLLFEQEILQQASQTVRQATENDHRHFDRMQVVVCKLQNEVVKVVCTIEDLLTFADQTRNKMRDQVVRTEELLSNVSGLNVDVNMLVQERIDRKRQIAALIEQLEQIKCVKANREEVEEMVVVKADIVDMRTKVSHAHFSEVTRDLSLVCVDALEKIVETDAEWHRAVAALVRLLDLKLERSEAVALDRTITDRLVALKDKLRAFAMFRLSCESAATEQKYLKEVRCLACNAQTYQKAEETLPEIPRMERFGRQPDEAALQFARVTVPCSKRTDIGITTRVKRYCGGDHTRLAPQERVSKKGDFIVQTGGVPLGPDVMHSMRGTDGVLYRVDVNRCDCRAENAPKIL